MINGLRTIGTSVLNSTIGSSKADNAKDKNTEAVVGAVTLVVFSIGTCYGLSAISRSLTTKIITPLTPQEEANLKWGLPLAVKVTLDKLFEGSPYSIDALPFYPNCFEAHHVEKEKMTAPIMKGTIDGHRFIAIKLEGDLTDGYINEHASFIAEDVLKKPRNVKDILVLHQYRKDKELMWDGGRGHSYLNANFFTWNFTYGEDGSGPTDSQKDNFARVQNLIKTGAGPDIRGMVWKIPKE